LDRKQEALYWYGRAVAKLKKIYDAGENRLAYNQAIADSDMTKINPAAQRYISNKSEIKDWFLDLKGRWEKADGKDAA
jgi:hypothetical protein